MKAIEVIDLAKTFGSGDDAVAAVRTISFEVDRGEIYGLLGPNGAGKTTTVLMLATLLAPSSGTAVVAGYDVRNQPEEVRRRVGSALQETGLDSSLTGREHLELHARLWGESRPASRRRAAELLELVGLEDAANRRVETYSGGMRRRLDLALGLVHQPQVLFLDEPTTGLDPASRRTVWNEVVRLNEEHGMTIVLTTQYLEEADQLAARVAIIDAGVIVRQGTPEELKRDLGGEVVEVTVATPELAVRGAQLLDGAMAHGRIIHLTVRDGARTMPVVIRALEEQGIVPEAVSAAKPTLDDVFLDATGHRLEGALAQQGGQAE